MITCIICHSNDIEVLALPTKSQFGYDKCNSCGILATKPKLSSGKNLTENRQFNHRFNSLGEILYGINAWTRFKYINKVTRRKSGRILDYGCGRGDLLLKFQKSGWDVHGAEYSETTSKEARQIHSNILLRSDFERETITYYPPSSFDLVTSFHNLEHLSDPSYFIEKCSQVIRKGGHLVLEVPNLESWQSRITGLRWLYLDPLNHTFHFTQRGLRILLKGYHFEIQRISSLAFWMGTIGMTSSLINKFRSSENTLFHQMKKTDSYPKIIREGILFACIYPFGVGLEFLSVLARSGSVIRIVAVRK